MFGAGRWFRPVLAGFRPVLAVRTIAMKGDVHLSGRRVMKKIKMGKARPAIFHQFETLVEMSDGSVVKRRSQAPKDEIRMINDQRNSTVWNPNRSDLVSVDANATGKVNKFRKRYSAFAEQDEGDAAVAPATASATATTKSDEVNGPTNDNFIELMGHGVSEVQKGGKLVDKKNKKKK